jgi:hypothetical protein
LKIALDSTFDYRLLDSITVSSENFYSSAECDTSSWSIKNNGILIFHCDSMSPENYILRIKTIFDKEQTFSFSLSDNASYSITNQLGFKPVDLIAKSDLLKADTIELVYTSNGCFHSYSEKTALCKEKKGGKYFLSSVADKTMINGEPLSISKEVPAIVVDDLFALENDSKKMKEDSITAGILKISTTIQRVYLLANRKLFQFSDQGIIGWNSYNTFISKYMGVNN